MTRWDATTPLKSPFSVYSKLERYRQAVAQITPLEGQELERYYLVLLPLDNALQGISTLALRSQLLNTNLNTNNQQLMLV